MDERASALEDLVTASGRPDPGWWRSRRVLLTGHTGFKGAWAALWLNHLGAEIHGFALPPATEPSLWAELGAGLLAGETLADLADLEALRSAVSRARPQIVMHMAAQALVRQGYSDPVGTVATNVLGTAHLLEALRSAEGLEAVLVVTTDKVYANDEGGRPFVESDRLGGRDPYSSSKAAAELVTAGFAASFFEPRGIPVATARAGNVIGGGDWSADRLAPDVWRAARAGEAPRLRSPSATRPWQHILEVLSGYFVYVQALMSDRKTARSLNFGPAPGDELTAGELAGLIGEALGAPHAWRPEPNEDWPEMQSLSIDSDKARRSIGWMTRLDGREAARWSGGWYALHAAGMSARDACLDQIREYEALP